jgi:menaquinone-9 beta-reductase
MRGTATVVASREETDAVVVGSRCAGSAAAIALARRGRRVIALDRATFPSDTVSTHVLWATGVAELKWLGALERVRAVGAPEWRVGHFHTTILARTGQRLDPHGRMSPIDGIDYGLCTRRPGLDFALVETARSFGAEVREGADVEDIVWAGGRAAGVRYKTADGALHEVRAKLVVGADGRRSTIAKLLGVEQPYRGSQAGRGLVFRYVKDPRGPDERDMCWRWQSGDTLGFFFPNDGNVGLVLFMPPKEEIKLFRRDPEHFERKLESFPELKARLEGCEPLTKLRSVDDPHAFFRISSGPGWALAGDAAHFKDPVLAQGIRDALRFGRLLGDTVADTLDDSEKLDRALYAYELNRDRECLPSYYLGQRETRTRPLTQLQAEMYLELDADSQLGNQFVDLLGDVGIADEYMDVAARQRDPRKFFTPRRLARWTWRAARRPGAERIDLAREVLEELRYEVLLRRDLAIVRTGRRADFRRWARWGRNGWAPGAAMRAEPTVHRPGVVGLRTETIERTDDQGGGRVSISIEANGAPEEPGPTGLVKVAAIQPRLEIGEVERNLARIEDLIRQAHREHNADLIVAPEAMTSPTVYHPSLRSVARPVDGAPYRLLVQLSRQLGCAVGGGFVARRGPDTRGTYVLAEPDGTTHLHDKDQPSMWENHYYTAGRDDGLFTTALGTIGCPMGFEWDRSRTARRLRSKAALLAGGSNWWSYPSWRLLDPWFGRDHQYNVAVAREMPGRLARAVGAPAVISSHVGPLTCRTPLIPGVAWPTIMVGETQVVDSAGRILAKLDYDEGEGYVAADVELGPAPPLDPIPSGFWMGARPVSLHLVWYLQNTYGRLSYAAVKRRRGFTWQSQPAADIPAYNPAKPAAAAAAPELVAAGSDRNSE